MREGFLRVIPVADHDRIAASAQLAGHAASHDAAPLIHVLHFDVRMNASHRRDAVLRSSGRDGELSGLVSVMP